MIQIWAQPDIHHNDKIVFVIKFDLYAKKQFVVMEEGLDVMAVGRWIVVNIIFLLLI